MYKDILQFIFQKKKWWLIPPIIVFVIFGVLILLSWSSPVSPFVYMLF